MVDQSRGITWKLRAQRSRIIHTNRGFFGPRPWSSAAPRFRPWRIGLCGLAAQQEGKNRGIVSNRTLCSGPMASLAAGLAANHRTLLGLDYSPDVLMPDHSLSHTLKPISPYKGRSPGHRKFRDWTRVTRSALIRNHPVGVGLRRGGPFRHKEARLPLVYL